MAASLGYVDEVIRPRETRARLCRALAALGQQARHQPPQEARKHSVVRPLEGVPALPRSRARLSGRPGRGALLLAGGCATAPQPVTKIVNGRRGHHARGQPRSLRARDARAAVRGGGALEGGGRRAAARAAVRSRCGRGARAAGGALHPAGPARRRRRAGRAVAADRADGGRLPGQGAPGRGARRRGARRAGDPGAARGGARWRWRATIAEAIERDAPGAGRGAGGGAGSAGGAGDRAPAGATRCRRRCAGASSWRRGLGEGALDEAERGAGGGASRSSRTTSRRASCWPSCRSRPADDAAKDGFRDAIDRAESPMAVADAFAGWLVLRGELGARRRSWPTD